MGTATFLEAASGACMDAADQKVWNGAGKTGFSADLSKCGHECVGMTSCTSSASPRTTATQLAVLTASALSPAAQRTTACLIVWLTPTAANARTVSTITAPPPSPPAPALPHQTKLN